MKNSFRKKFGLQNYNKHGSCGVVYIIIIIAYIENLTTPSGFLLVKC